MGEKLVCQALYNQCPGDELPSLTPPGHREPQVPGPQSSVTPRISWVAGACDPELLGPSCSQIMPCLEAVALVLLIVLVPDPPRGAAEKQGELAMGGLRSSWSEDIRYLGRK